MTTNNENVQEVNFESLPLRETSQLFVLKRLYPWLIILLSSFFLFYKYVLQVSPSVMANELMRDFKINGTGLGNLAATYFYAYLIMQLLAGPLLDRFNPRVLTTLAIGVCALGALAFSNTHSLEAAVMARALMGVGTAFATVSYMKLSAMWFRPHQVAFVDGLLATAAMLGALCGQVPLTLLVDFTGWRESLLYCGFFGIILAVLFMLTVKNKKNEGPLLSSSPKPTWQAMIALLKTKKNWVLTFYSGLAFTPVAVLGGLWGNPFFEVSHHLNATQAASFTSLIFLGLAIGSPLFGFFADRINKRIPVMMFGTTLSFITLTMAIYLMMVPLWLFGLLLFIFGLGTGVFMLSYPLGKSINPYGLAATVVGLINTGDALFGSFTEPLIGKILDIFWHGKIENGVHFFSTHEFQVAFAILPLYLLLALMALYILKKLR